MRCEVWLAGAQPVREELGEREPADVEAPVRTRATVCSRSRAAARSLVKPRLVEDLPRESR
jgi:hypothetical protein